MSDFIRNNPALFYSFSIGLTGAVVTLLLALGVPASPAVLAAVTGLVTMVTSIIIGVVTKGKVVPFQNVLEYRTLGEDGSLSTAVIAGPANDQEVVGRRVREVGEPAYGSHTSTDTV